MRVQSYYEPRLDFFDVFSWCLQGQALLNLTLTEAVVTDVSCYFFLFTSHDYMFH